MEGILKLLLISETYDGRWSNKWYIFGWKHITAADVQNYAQELKNKKPQWPGSIPGKKALGKKAPGITYQQLADHFTICLKNETVRLEWEGIYLFTT